MSLRGTLNKQAVGQDLPNKASNLTPQMILEFCVLYENRYHSNESLKQSTSISYYTRGENRAGSSAM